MAKIQFDEADLDLDAFKDSTTNLWDRKPFEVLQRYLQPDGDLSLSETSRLILAMQPDQPLKKGQFSIWNNIGYHVLAVSRQIPYNHPSQIKLALLMKRLASAKKASAEYTGDVSSTDGSYNENTALMCLFDRMEIFITQVWVNFR